MANTSNNSCLSKNSPRAAEYKEISKIMSKILNVSEQKILDSIEIFSNMNPEMKICLDKLHRIRKEDYVNTFIILEYYLTFDKPALESIRKIDLKQLLPEHHLT